MSKIRLKLPSWVATMIDAKSSGWLTLEKETGKDTTVSDLLADLAVTCTGFRQAVYDPDTGLVNEQINVILNDNLLTFREVSETKLTDGDTVILIPLYYGG